MPKMKTHRGAAKRFGYTAKGKVRRRKAGLRHILVGKSRKRKNSLGKTVLVSSANHGEMERMLPYR